MDGCFAGREDSWDGLDLIGRRNCPSFFFLMDGTAGRLIGSLVGCGKREEEEKSECKMKRSFYSLDSLTLVGGGARGVWCVWAKLWGRFHQTIFKNHF